MITHAADVHRRAVVQAMTVSPSHWGNGLGKRLLKRGLEEVDKAGQYGVSPSHHESTL